MPDKVERVVELLLTTDHATNVRWYLDRGRKYKASSDTFLKHYFLAKIEQWASIGPTCAPLQHLYDIESECSLRGVELPYDEAAECLDRVGKTIAQSLIEPCSR